MECHLVLVGEEGPGVGEVMVCVCSLEVCVV